MTFVEWAVNNQMPLLFYGAIILLIIFLRHKFEWQGFAIGICRTNTGLKLMTRWGTKYRGLLIVFGYIGIGVGFAGMGLIMWSLLQGAWKFVTDVAAPPVVTPVIPGFAVPGFSGLEVPLITGWVALFALLVIHEFSHGLVSVAHRIPVKSSGLLVFGPLFGAFVEPDEKKVDREHETVNYAISAAGPWSNILTAGIAIVLSIILIAPFGAWASPNDGVLVKSVPDGYPAAIAGMTAGSIITSVDGVPITTRAELSTRLDPIPPGAVVTLGTSTGDFTLETAVNPENPQSQKGYVGVIIDEHRAPRSQEPFWVGLAFAARKIELFFYWFVLLSLGIGLANLLPIGPLDGGRMFRLAAQQVTGDQKRGDWWWKKVSVVTVVLLVGLLLFPLVRWIVA